MKKTGIHKFLELAESIPVVDVRSPSEFKAGHIPGAFNIPLFDDQEREAVGITYKKESRNKAIIKGIELTGPAMHLKLLAALKIAKENKLLVHCWRGGMRSETMAWLFTLGDMNVEVLDGGYKTYRRHILSRLAEERKVIILGGMTGSSKTHILHHIRKLKHQFIDLEGLANHKGSAFGALGQPAQPTSEHFANLLYNEWVNLDNNLPVWIEDESRNIGTVFMPDFFYNNLQKAPVIILIMDVDKRVPRLIEEYSTYPPEMLKNSIMKISKRMGGDNTKDAIDAVDTGDFEKAIRITLKYYDKAYLYGITKKHSGNVIYVEAENDDIEANANKILEASKQITWESD